MRRNGLVVKELKKTLLCVQGVLVRGHLPHDSRRDLNEAETRLLWVLNDKEEKPDKWEPANLVAGASRMRSKDKEEK